MKLSLLIPLALFLCPALLRPDEAPRPIRPDPARFAKDIAAFDAAEKTNPPERGGIVFTGSSSVRLWDVKKAFPDLPVLNRGFGGSVAHDVIVYADQVILRYQPKLLVLYTGSNDLHGHPTAPVQAGLTPEEALADYTSLLNLVHEKLPQTRVIVSSVKVAPVRATEMPSVKKLNLLLEAWCRDKSWIRWVEATNYLLGSDGQPIESLYRADRLHLNDEGYAKWNAVIGPVIREEWARAAR
jgi:lysophospholipase L1-like esterase